MSRSCNDNQNYFVESGRTTSRVLRAPGGKSSIQLGWDDCEQGNKASVSVGKKSEKEVTGKIGQPGGEINSNANKNEAHANSWGKDSEQSGAGVGGEASSAVSGNSFASGSNMNCVSGLHSRPSSRVINPPGGRTSFTFG